MTERIAHRYEVRELLHEGRLKTVYRVADLRAPGRDLVLKLVAEGDAQSRSLLRFHNEFRIASDLAHPGLCRVLELGHDRDRGQPFMVEEAAAGVPLSHLPALPHPGIVRDVLVHAARVLGYLHGRGIVHFDVKPDNLVVEPRPDGRGLSGFKLLDFDLAGAPGPGSAGRGTMPFIAPEVLSGDEVIDGRADLYSLGATMVSLITGNDLPEIPLVADVADLLAGLPAGALERYGAPTMEILHGLLRPYPDERIASGRDLLIALAECHPNLVGESPESRLASILRPKMVGRHEEMTRLRDVMPGTEEPPVLGDGRVPPFVLLRGERGVGRTRLFEQHGVALKTSRHVVLSLAPRARGGHGPSPIRSLEREAQTLLGEEPTKGAADWEFQDVADPRRFARFSSIGQSLLRIARSVAPVCIVVDDVHYLEPMAEELLAYLMRRIGAEFQGETQPPKIQLLLSCVRGRVDSGELEGLITELREDGLLDTIDLEPFTHAQSAELLAAMIAPDVPTPAASDSLFEKTHGNALFLRETVASLMVRADRVEDADTAFSAERLAAAPVADKVRGVIQSRVSRVKDEDLFLLQLVALHPRQVDAVLLGRAAGVGEAELAASLERLVGRGLLAMSRSGSLAFLDLDAKEVVVDMMTDRRRPLHERLADALEAAVPESEDGWTLAFHRLRSGAAGDAVWNESYVQLQLLSRGRRDGESIILIRTLLQRGDAPFYLRFMATAALADIQLRRGDSEGVRKLLGDPDLAPFARSVIVAERLAHACSMQSQYGQAREVLQEASEAAGDDNLVTVAELTLRRARTWQKQGRLDAATAALAKVGDLLERLDALPELELSGAASLDRVESPPLPPSCPFVTLQAEFLRLRAELEFAANRLPAALALALLCVKMEARSGNLPGLGQGLKLAGTIYMRGRELARAAAHFSRALELQRDVGDPMAEADTLNNLGVLSKELGEYHDAIRYLREALQIRREIGDRAGEVQCWSNIANIHILRRELSAAAETLTTCLKLKRKLLDDQNSAVILSSLGAVAELRDRYSAALRYQRDAAAADRSFGQTARALLWDLNAARLLAMAGLANDAELALDEAMTAVRASGLDRHLPGALWGKAEVATQRRDWQDAEQALGEALEFCSQKKFEADRIETLVRTLALHVASADVERGRWSRDAIRRCDLDLLEEEVRERLAWSELELATLEGRFNARGEAPEVDAVVESLKRSQRLKMPGQAFGAAAALAWWFDRADLPERAFYHHTVALRHLEEVVAAIGDSRMMSGWLGTPRVVAWRERAAAFIAHRCPGREEESKKLPPDVRDAVARLKKGFFDVERELDTSLPSLRRSEEGIRRILEISQTLTSTMPMEHLLEKIVDGVIDFSRAERAFLILTDEAGQAQMTVARNIHREVVPDAETQISRKVIEQVIETRSPLRIQNAMDEEDFRMRRSVLRLELRSIMCVPLMRDDALMGIIYVDNRSRIGQFQGEDLELLAILATHSAIAIENARLVRDFVREEKNRSMGVLAGSVAHDFNNLLAKVIGRTQLLRRKTDDDRLDRELAIIEAAALEGANHVRRLQDFTRISKRSDLAAVHLRGIVDEVLEFTRTKWESEFLRTGRRVEITNRLADDVIVRGNASELRELITNVLLNVIAALQEGGAVVFEAVELEDLVRLRIREDGVSADAAREALLDPLLSSNDREGSLGMSVAYGILMRHGGRVSIENEGGERVIVIELPRETDRRERGAVAIAGTGPRADPSSRRILVVDDEEGIRGLLEEILSREGYQVVQAESGPKALELQAQNRFDLVLTDLGMVPMSGWDVAREVKKRDAELPVVLLTGWAEEIETESARARQVDRVLSKPFDVDELLAAIESTMNAATRS